MSGFVRWPEKVTTTLNQHLQIKTARINQYNNILFNTHIVYETTETFTTSKRGFCPEDFAKALFRFHQHDEAKKPPKKPVFLVTIRVNFIFTR